MCRYAMHSYKPHYACFDCRKTFKRRLLSDVAPGRQESVAGQWFRADAQKLPSAAPAAAPARCPDCGGLAAGMGLDFQAPPKTDRKAWQHLRSLYAVGIAFHSCGCGGPGLVPATPEALVAHLEQQLAGYVAELRYWLTRPQPVTKAEVERDKQQNWHRNGGLVKDGKGRVDAAAALAHWQQRVQQLTDYLGQARLQVR